MGKTDEIPGASKEVPVIPTETDERATGAAEETGAKEKPQAKEVKDKIDSRLEALSRMYMSNTGGEAEEGDEVQED